MARSIWTGYIGLGLVSIPVGLFSATQEHEVDFHQFQRGTSDRIRYKRVNERTGREVGHDDIVTGHDIGGGQYVIVEPDELDGIAPGRSRALTIDGFVDLAEIDPIHFQKSYYLAPSDPENSAAYALLREALERTGRAGVGTFVMCNKEYLAAVPSSERVLVLETMFFADEIRDPEAIVDDLPERSRSRKQLGTAADLVGAMTVPWKPTDYHDTYTERVENLVDAKRRGESVVTENEPEATGVSDLLSALESSVSEARKGRRRARRSTGSKRKRPKAA